MDINDIRSAVTVIGLLLFVALIAYTWWPSRRAAHQAASALPFQGEGEPSKERSAS